MVKINLTILLISLIDWTESLSIYQSNKLSDKKIDCNTNGTLYFENNLCKCKINVKGSNCNECKFGYFDLDKNGCKKCSCFNGYHLIKKDDTRNNSEKLNENNFDKLENNFLSLNDENQYNCKNNKQLFLDKIEANFENQFEENFILLQFSLEELKKINLKKEMIFDNLKMEKELKNINEIKNYFESDSLNDKKIFFKQLHHDDTIKKKLNLIKQLEFRYQLKPYKILNYLEYSNDDFNNDNVYYWVANDKFLNNKLSSYGHKLKIKLFFSILRGDVSENTIKNFKKWPNLILVSIINNNEIKIGYKDTKSNFQPDENVYYDLILNENNWFILDNYFQLTEELVDQGLFKLILTKIDKFLIRAKYHTDQIESRLFYIYIEQPIENQFIHKNNTVEDQILNNLYSSKKKTNIEECICPHPFSGASCEKCKTGYHLVIHYNNEITKKYKKKFLLECKLCQCNGQLRKENSDCNCDNFTESNYFDQCKTGYLGNQLKILPCINCKKADLNHCSPCKKGYYYNSKENFSNNFKHQFINNEIKEKCFKCECFMKGSVDENCNQFTKQCKCKKNYLGLKCDLCENGFRFTKNFGCVEEFYWLNNSVNKCVTNLIDRYEKEDFESSINFISSKLIKNEFNELLKEYEFKHEFLKTKLNLFLNKKNFFKNFTIPDLYILSEKINHTSVTKKDSSLNMKIEKTNEINEKRISNINLINTKLFELYKEIKKQINFLKNFEKNSKEDKNNFEKIHQQEKFLNLINEDFLDSNFKKLKLKEDLLLSEKFFQNCSILNVNINKSKEELVNLFQKIFKIKNSLTEKKYFILNIINQQIEKVFDKNEKLKKLITSIEQIDRIILEEKDSLEQLIVDSNFLNNVTVSIKQKIEKNFNQFENNLHNLNLEYKKLNNFLQLNEKNQFKYMKDCDKHLINLNKKIDINIKPLDQLINKQTNKLISSFKKSINTIHQIFIELNELDLLLNIEFNKSYIDDDLIFLNEKTNKLMKINNKLTIDINEINYKLDENEIKNEIIKNKTYITTIIDGLTLNQLINNIKRDLIQLTKKSLINKYQDFIVSPVIHLKNFEHESLLNLTKKGFFIFSKKITKIEENFFYLNPFKEILENKTLEIKKKMKIKENYIKPYENRKKNLENLNINILRTKEKIEKKIILSKQYLSNIKLILGITSIENSTCKRLIKMNNLEKTSVIDISFLISIGHQNKLINREFLKPLNHTFMLLGSFNEQFILFELINNKIKVSWNLNDYITNDLILEYNSEFKTKDLFYKVNFKRVGIKINLEITSPKKSIIKSHILNENSNEDLLVNLKNDLRVGLIENNTQIINKNLNNTIISISNLKINNKFISLWDFEKTNNACRPVKDSVMIDSNLNNFFIFDGIGSYMQFNQINRYDKQRNFIKIEFRTFNKNSFLFICYNEKLNHLIKITLNNGYVSLTISNGLYELELKTLKMYNTGLWYNLVIEREDYTVMMFINEEEIIGQLKSKKSYMSYTNTESLILELEKSINYVGGLPINLDYWSFSKSSNSFYGCIKQIQIDSTLINMENQHSYGVNGFNDLNDYNLVKQINFENNNSFIQFNNISFKNWKTFSFTFRTELTNCSILSLSTAEKIINDQKVNFSSNNSLQNLSLNEYEKKFPSIPKTSLNFNIINDKLNIFFNDKLDFNLTFLNNQNSKLNNGQFHTVYLINNQESISMIIDNFYQKEILEYHENENFNKLFEEFSILHLGKIRHNFLLEDLKFDFLSFVGTINNLVLNENVLKLDEKIEIINDINFS